MLQYMSEEELLDLKGPLENGKIMNVQLSEPITYEYNPVHPDQLQSVEETLALIKKGKLRLRIIWLRTRNVCRSAADTIFIPNNEETLQLKLRFINR